MMIDPKLRGCCGTLVGIQEHASNCLASGKSSYADPYKALEKLLRQRDELFEAMNKIIQIAKETM